ncbi:tetratricopeptide repeat protein [Streptomyces sp. NBC_00250]|uniref:tetratricopeptide repeat protein n=1 Tax=Streptomyces sp. NBC_00250 TaxID=2903641 RepID=UPI002E2D4411|nr:tetratricopeptide repeat protein [Streptomyces sp. NBC_00250]
MLEIMALSALTTFLLGVGNGATGELGKQLALSTGALARRTLGRATPLPPDPAGRAELAGRLHARISGDPRQAAEWALLVQSSPEASTHLAIGGLPPAPREFVNRDDVVRQLLKEATRPWEGSPRVALLYGPPGIGTSATALRLGALCQARFPDGQFHVDLRDTGANDGAEPAAVLLRLLLRMGVDRDRMPATEAGREELYRRLTAGKQVLVVIDHASSPAQVRGLVPSTPDVFLLVVVSGPPFTLDAERVPVSPLSDRHAKKLLRGEVGRERAARAKAQLPGLLDRCAGNALSLKTEAMRLLADDTGAPESGAEPPALNPVQRAAHRASRRITPEASRLCRLTALAAWPSISPALAAAAADLEDEHEADRLLAEAAEARLLEPLPDRRYRFRPAVRRYLADTAVPEHGIPECAAAVDRVLALLLNRVLHAAHAALPQSWRTEPAPERGDACRDEKEGLAVLAAEVGNVVCAVSVAEEYRRTTTALRLARALWPLQLKAGYGDEVLPALRVAARCADEQDRSDVDHRTAGALHFQLAHCLGELGRREHAERAAHAAVAHERAADHLRGEASSVELLGLLDLGRWEYETAYERFTEAERIYRRIAPGQEGAEDLPRALALAGRHQGRALRGLGRWDESRRLLEAAGDFFVRQGETYNRARVLTDLAELLHETGDNAAALTRITEAERLLPEAAAPHLRYLEGLRRRCEDAP